ncbi:MAG: hypothetical protein ACREPW_10030, partial [Candidatus Binataceae bacterium]
RRCSARRVPGGQSCAGGETGPGRSVGNRFRRFFYHFGFFEAWREAEDNAKYGKKMLPIEEATTARMERADFAYMGSVEDVRRKMDALVENAHPE